MAFLTTDLPQANKLEKVVQTVQAVYSGATNDLGIANAIGFTDRQGRYYRHAAELLGFITNEHNSATVTVTGLQLIEADQTEQKSFLQAAILNNDLFRIILEYIKPFNEGVTKQEIADYIYGQMIDPSASTIDRRLSTLLQWLTDPMIELLIKDQFKYTYNPITLTDDIDTEAEDIYRRDDIESIYPSDTYAQELDIREEHITVFGLLRRIEQGRVRLTPDFQRNMVWKPIQKSLFIESLLLNIPLPPIYVSQDLEGNYTIVDGLQRTSTLEQYHDDQFPLIGLKAMASINGKRFSQLSGDLKTRIEDKNLLLYILRPSIPLVVVYDIFNRINTGGTPLTRQEIRNCIYIGPATGLLRELADSKSFKKATDYGISANRMKDREAVLRCLAFMSSNYHSHYNNDMDEFLGRCMRSINQMSSEKIVNIGERFIRAMDWAYLILGKIAFRLPIKSSRGIINIAVMESVCLFITKQSDDFLVAHQDRIRVNYTDLVNDPNYVEAVRYSTGATSKVFKRFELASSKLGNVY